MTNFTKILESQFFNHRWVVCEVNTAPHSDEKGAVWIELTDISRVQVGEDIILIHIKTGGTYMFHVETDEINAFDASLYLLREIEFANGRMPIPGDM
jgi:hypothetical protein